jgi:ribose transport system substrate-binding protein
MRTPALLLACVLPAALMVSCGGGEEKEGRYTIAVIPKGETHEFWKSVHAGAAAAADELDVEILWKGPTSEDARKEQNELIERMLSRGVDGIVLAPLDFNGTVGPIERARERGIPVVVIDSDVNTGRRVSFIATDNRKGGYKGGRKLVELLGGEGDVLLLRYVRGSASTDAREAGFVQAIDETGGKVKIVMEDEGGARSGDAQKKAEAMLSKVKAGAARIDGIFCPNESTTRGMLNALRKADMLGRVKFVGFDIADDLREALEGGRLHAVVLQDPYRMGHEGVRAMVAHLTGRSVEPRIDTGATVVTKDNMHDEKLRNLVFPPQR